MYAATSLFRFVHNRWKWTKKPPTPTPSMVFSRFAKKTKPLQTSIWVLSWIWAAPKFPRVPKRGLVQGWESVLRGRGFPYLKITKMFGFSVSWFLGFLLSWVLGFSVSWFLGFLISWFLGFKVSKTQKWHSLFLEDIDPMLPTSHCMFFDRCWPRLPDFQKNIPCFW